MPGAGTYEIPAIGRPGPEPKTSSPARCPRLTHTAERRTIVGMADADQRPWLTLPHEYDQCKLQHDSWHIRVFRTGIGCDVPTHTSSVRGTRSLHRAVRILDARLAPGERSVAPEAHLSSLPCGVPP